jgi:hypothetical protein
LVSTRGGKLTRNDRLFLSWMAPRGIVAAAIASIFALRLEENGHEAASAIVPVTFITIIATVMIYGLTAPLVARRLKLAEAAPQGLLIVGAHAFARSLAEFVQKQGFRVLVVDTNWNNIHTARMAGIPAYHGSILAEYALDEIDLGGLGRLLAMTPNDWVNILTVQRFTHVFGKANCFQLPPQQQDAKDRHRHLYGKWLFNKTATYPALQSFMSEGRRLKATKISGEFKFIDFRAEYGDGFLPIATLTESKRLNIASSEKDVDPRSGQTLFTLVKGNEPAARSA